MEHCSKRIPSALPPIEEVDLWLQLTPKQQWCYAAMPDVVEDESVTFTLLHVLKAVCSHPMLLSEERRELLLARAYSGDGAAAASDVADVFGRVDPCSASSKLSMLAALLPILRAEGHRVVVFSRSKRFLELVDSAVMAPTMTGAKAQRLSSEVITGDMAVEERGCIFERFNNPRSAARAIFALLITEQLGQVGLNLTGADVVISLDPWWNPAVTAQAMHRVHRIKQVCFYLPLHFK